MKITSNNGSILIFTSDDQLLGTIPFGAQTVSLTKEGVRLSLLNTSIHYNVPSDVTINGDSFSDVNDIVDTLSAFKKGGGNGSSGVASISGDGVNNTDPSNPVISYPTLDDVLDKGNIGSTQVTLKTDKNIASGNEGVTVYGSPIFGIIEHAHNGKATSRVALGDHYVEIISKESSDGTQLSLFIDSKRKLIESTGQFRGADAVGDSDFTTLQQLKAYTLEDSTNAGNHTQVGIGVTGSEGDAPENGVYITHNASGVTSIGHYRGGVLQAEIEITSGNEDVGSGIEMMAGGNSFVLRDQGKFSTPVQGEDAVEDKDFVTKGQVEGLVSKVVIDDTSEESLTKEVLNTTYPDLNIGSQVYATLINKMYTKISTDSWASIDFEMV